LYFGDGAKRRLDGGPAFDLDKASTRPRLARMSIAPRGI